VDVARLHAEQNVLLDLQLGGFQLTSSTVSLLANKVEKCGGTGVAISAGLKGNSTAELNCNSFTLCSVGLRTRNSGASHCHLSAVSDTYTANGDAICAIAHASVNKRDPALGHVAPSHTLTKPTSRCLLALSSCRMVASKRSGIRLGRGVHARIWHCDIMGNGRGVVAAAWASVDIQRCRFGDNVGWGVRLEGSHNYHDHAELDAQEESPDTHDKDHEPSVLSYNVFVSSQRGAVGSKRIRIDPWHELRTNADSNSMEASGCEVQPELKRHRQLEQEEVDAAAGVLACLCVG